MNVVGHFYLVNINIIESQSKYLRTNNELFEEIIHKMAY